MIVLGLETSCDETAAAVVGPDGVRSDVTHSQEVHARFGGVVPELAARAHVEKVGTVVAYAMSPGGRWLAVQAGDNARRVYRYDLSLAKPQPELVFEAAKGQTLGAIALTDEGHVLAAPQTWVGEIHVVDAAPGTRF